MVEAVNLGFPRIGAKRELKKAVELFWKGDLTEADLQKEAANLRMTHWKMQQQAGIKHIPANDFSFYDQVLDTIALVGAVPEIYGFKGGNVDLTTYFAMARGQQFGGKDVPAMEMTKWFDTNYHYIVPEFHKGQKFALSSQKPFAEFKEAKAAGISARPVVLGPVTFLLVGKSKDEGFNPLTLLNDLLPVYAEVLNKLEAEGAEWIQIDEPALVLDLSAEAKAAFKTAYETLAKGRKAKIAISTYFGGLRDNLQLAVGLPVQALYVDLVRAPEQLDEVLAALPADKILSAGVVDGRNIWKTDLSVAESKISKAVAKLGADRVWVAPSCSLQHSPVDLDNETKLDADIKNWLAFAKQKLVEVAKLAEAANGKKDTAYFADNAAAAASRKTSKKIHDDAVKARIKAITPKMADRASPYASRAPKQQAKFNLPLLPTTTIGSFPQTAEVRKARADFKSGTINAAQYQKFLEEETVRTIRIQEDLDIDALVHGEFERNDMVEYFGEQLSGFTFSSNGWVQS